MAPHSEANNKLTYEADMGVRSKADEESDKPTDDKAVDLAEEIPVSVLGCKASQGLHTFLSFPAAVTAPCISIHITATLGFYDIFLSYFRLLI